MISSDFLILLGINILLIPMYFFIFLIIGSIFLYIRDYIVKYINRCDNKGHELITYSLSRTKCRKCFKVFNKQEIHDEYIKFIKNESGLIYDN
jgi:hypothetical protein